MINNKISKYKSNKKLLKKYKQNAGRNNQGRITVAHKGGGHRQLYRNINFIRLLQKYIVINIEYDPYRTAFIAQLSLKDKNKKNQNIYILAPKNLQILDEIINSSKRKPFIHIGDSYPLKTIPIGTIIHNIELEPSKGGKFSRSAGTYGKILQKYNDKYINIQLSSGEQRLILADCMATIGIVSNIDNKSLVLKKAGRSRWLGIRPTVRGVAMNPVDHPHGGGEGKTSGGRPSVTPWARLTKGKPTRSNIKNNKFIVVKRKDG